MSKSPGGTINERTHYEVLGISEDATADEIRSAWRVLIRDLHPDRVSDEESKHRMNEKAAEVNAAHSALKDPASRRRYDEELEHERAAFRSETYSEEDFGRPWTGTGSHDPGTDYSGGYSADEPDWERIQAEAEAEAVEAWDTWENPTLRERLRQGWQELAHDEIPDSGKLGFVDDYSGAWDDYDDSGVENGVAMFTLPGFSALMARMAIGGLVLLMIPIFDSGLLALGIAAGAFALDIFLCGCGARPARYVAYQSGSRGQLSEGQKILSIPAFAIRSLWLGVIQFGVAYNVVMFMAWMYHLDQQPSPVEPFIGYGLGLFPFIWGVVFIVVWIRKTVQQDRDEHSYGAGEAG